MKLIRETGKKKEIIKKSLQIIRIITNPLMGSTKLSKNLILTPSRHLSRNPINIHKENHNHKEINMFKKKEPNSLKLKGLEKLQEKLTKEENPNLVVKLEKEDDLLYLYNIFKFKYIYIY